jgi:hypothetical protein
MDYIEADITVDGSPEWTARKLRMHLPSVITTVPIITHLDRRIVEQDEHEYIIRDEWEVNVLRPLPGWLSSYLPIRMIEVDSTLYWDDQSRTVEWYLSLPNWPELLPVCEGTVVFEEQDDETRIKLEGHFDLDPSVLPGVPGLVRTLLSGRQGPLAERIIERYLPDLKSELEAIDLEKSVTTIT